MSAEIISDVLIIGAGPAGLSAALAAASQGQQVMIIDDNPFAGGQIWRDGKGANIPVKAKLIRHQVEQHPHIRCLQSTKVISVVQRGDHNGIPFALLLESADQSWIQYTHAVIICSGGRELQMPYPGWTLPGVTGAGGLQALIKGGLPVAGQRIVIAGTGPLLLATAKTAREAGADVVYIAEQTTRKKWWHFGLSLWRWPKKLWQACFLMTTQLHTASYVSAVAVQGQQLKVTVQSADKTVDILCDRLACGYGLIPNTELAQLLGCALTKDGSIAVSDHMETSVPGVYAAGECTGFGGADKALIQGNIAGYEAIGDVSHGMQWRKQLSAWLCFAALLKKDFAIRDVIKSLPKNETIICRCEDITYEKLIDRESWIDAKLHTRCGMGPCQGRICGAAAQVLFDWESVPQRYLLSPVRVASLVQCSLHDNHH